MSEQKCQKIYQSTQMSENLPEYKNARILTKVKNVRKLTRLQKCQKIDQCTKMSEN